MSSNISLATVEALSIWAETVVSITQESKRSQAQADKMLSSMKAYCQPQNTYPGRNGTTALCCGGQIDSGGHCPCGIWDHDDKTRVGQ